MKHLSDKQRTALRYYLIGLNSVEIGKLTGYSPRTVQGLARAGKWREIANGTPPAKTRKIYEMYTRHKYTRAQIADYFGRSPAWVACELRKGKKLAKTAEKRVKVKKI